MSVSGVTVLPNPTIPSSLSVGGLYILSGIVTCVFKGSATSVVTKDTLTFKVGPVNFPGSSPPRNASCVVSPASIAYDGSVSDALWAVDSARVQNFVDVDRGSGTANLEVVADLAVRGMNGIILRVNYIVFYLN